MGAHMKTTIEISDAVLTDARKLAAREGLTLRALVELGLRRLIAEKKRATGFRLRRASYKGNGLQAGLSKAPPESACARWLTKGMVDDRRGHQRAGLCPP